jgi:hypothetical protein
MAPLFGKVAHDFACDFQWKRFLYENVPREKMTSDLNSPRFFTNFLNPSKSKGKYSFGGFRFRWKQNQRKEQWWESMLYLYGFVCLITALELEFYHMFSSVHESILSTHVLLLVQSLVLLYSMFDLWYWWNKRSCWGGVYVRRGSEEKVWKFPQAGSSGSWVAEPFAPLRSKVPSDDW